MIKFQVLTQFVRMAGMQFSIKLIRGDDYSISSLKFFQIHKSFSFLIAHLFAYYIIAFTSL